MDRREVAKIIIEETTLRFFSLLCQLDEEKSSRFQNYSPELWAILQEKDNMEDAIYRIRHFGELDLLDDDGLKKMMELCIRVSDAYGLGVETNRISNRQSAPDSGAWRIYLNEDGKVFKVDYGTDKTKAQVVKPDGNIGSEIAMTGADYEGKGFAKKLLTAAGLRATKKADFELQEKMLDGGLFYINKEEGWIEKEKYFERMTPKDFLEIQDYKDVSVKAVYEDSKGELTFTYTVDGRAETLFVIKASNRQKKREYPSASGNNEFPSDASIDKERKKIEIKTMPDDGTKPVDYIPGKFPKGNWKINSFEENGEKEYGPYKIRTDAYRYVEAWEEFIDSNTQKKKWRKKVDANGNVIKTRDSGLLIHGGGWSESALDNKKGANKYTDTTLGCIRISNLNVLLIVKVLQAYLNSKKFIALEVK